jgi:3-deoxy-D-manno-octulosonate 8-phosphate phosphatase (KDO 8-P phosphatase)
MDVDGVLTDGGVWWGPNGEEWKRFHFADIMGLSLARKAGMVIALMSGENSPLVDRLASKFGITDVHKECKDKAGALRSFSEKHGLRLQEICFIGDDVNDLTRAQHRRPQCLPCGRAPFHSRALPGRHEARRW